ncbi:glycosyltransferase [Microbacterium sp. JZ70]
MPRLSVLMPAFDAAPTIDRAVRSTLRDLPADAELVVQDDGSSDGTLAALERIDDPRLRVLTGPNRGVARALNALLEASASEFVARMDADDVVLPGRFRRQLRALKTADTVFTTVASWHGAGVPRPPWPSGIGIASFPFHLLLTNPVAHSTMAARRSAVEAVRGYRVVPSEDYDLWLRLASSGARLRRLAAPSLLYRVHPGQVTSAEGWRLRSWNDERTQAAFAELSARVLGAPLPRLTALAVAPLPAEEKAACLDEFERRFRCAASRLRPTDRAAVLPRLARRAAWCRERIRAAADERAEAAS